MDPTQPLIDAFRAFQIPDDYRERFGYPTLTPAIKAKILGHNAARVYNIDRQQTLINAKGDDVAWVKQAVDDYKRFGLDP